MLDDILWLLGESKYEPAADAALEWLASSKSGNLTAQENAMALAWYRHAWFGRQSYAKSIGLAYVAGDACYEDARSECLAREFQALIESTEGVRHG